MVMPIQEQLEEPTTTTAHKTDRLDTDINSPTPSRHTLTHAEREKEKKSIVCASHLQLSDGERSVSIDSFDHHPEGRKDVFVPTFVDVVDSASGRNATVHRVIHRCARVLPPVYSLVPSTTIASLEGFALAIVIIIVAIIIICIIC